MAAFACIACGSQSPPSSRPPAECPICDDMRGIAAGMAPWRHDATYGASWNLVIAADGERAMQRSVDRHPHWLQAGPEA